MAKSAARRIRWFPIDMRPRHSSNGMRLPPRGLSFVGAGDFEATGHEFLRYFTDLGGLEPGHRVLDAGCGIGRMALPLTDFLDQGSYEGFDVGREMIAWCGKNITPRYPRFQFTWAPVHNRKYNPFGSIKASEYRFPYPDDSFDFAFATSLFTHLGLDDVRHYLTEISRVLKPGGTAFLTFFLLTPQSRAAIDDGRSMLPFAHEALGGLATSRTTPEDAIAFPETTVIEVLGDAGLSTPGSISHGAWANAPGALTLQDVVVASNGEAEQNLGKTIARLDA